MIDKLVAQLLRQNSNEALEKAAVVAETLSPWNDTMNLGPKIAQAIRDLKEEGDGKQESDDPDDECPEAQRG